LRSVWGGGIAMDRGSWTRVDSAWLVALLLVISVALLLRFWALEVRPLHHDEGVNGWFLDNLAERGYYRYNPEGFHGPLIYYLALLPLRLLGRSIFSLRLVPSLLGVLTVALVWLLRHRLGSAGAVAAAALLATSPVLVYYSRDFIHETYLSFFTLLFVVSAARFARSGRIGWLITASASLALAFATKETALLHGCVIAAAFLLSGLLDEAGTGKGFGRLMVAAREVWRRLARAAGRRPVGIALALAVFWSVIVAFFSSFFTNWRGVGDFFVAFLQWAKTGAQGQGHEKPAFYFISLMLRYDGVVLVVGILGIVVGLVRKRRFERFVALWALLTLVCYSAIPYKTPWLSCNIVVPLALCAAVFVRYVEVLAKKRRVLAWVCVVAFGLATGRSAAKAVDVSLVRYDDDTEPIVYVQTFRDLNRLLDQVDAVLRAAGGEQPPILVVSRDHWPLDWYLHSYRNCEFGELTAELRSDAAMVIGSIDQEAEIAGLLGDGYVVKHYDLRPGVSFSVFIKREYAPYAARAGIRLAPYLPLDTPIPMNRGLVARYYPNRQCLAPAYRTEIAKALCFSFENDSSKDFDVPVSITYTGYIRIVETGEYTFVLTSDDGSRLFLDDVLLIDNWGEHAARTMAASASLAAGFHRIKLEYFDVGWGAILRLEWRKPGSGKVIVAPFDLYHPAGSVKQ